MHWRGVGGNSIGNTERHGCWRNGVVKVVMVGGAELVTQGWIACMRNLETAFQVQAREGGRKEGMGKKREKPVEGSTRDAKLPRIDRSSWVRAHSLPTPVCCVNQSERRVRSRRWRNDDTQGA